jgi:hypothetical protein
VPGVVALLTRRTRLSAVRPRLAPRRAAWHG